MDCIDFAFFPFGLWNSRGVYFAMADSWYWYTVFIDLGFYRDSNGEVEGRKLRWKSWGRGGGESMAELCYLLTEKHCCVRFFRICLFVMNQYAFFYVKINSNQTNKETQHWWHTRLEQIPTKAENEQKKIIIQSKFSNVILKINIAIVYVYFSRSKAMMCKADGIKFFIEFTL